MTFSITQFENSTTNQLAALDNNFDTVNAALPIPCLVSGTNTLTLTQSPAGQVPTQAITAYFTNMQFSGIAVATNTGPVTATVGAIGAAPVYKDTLAGPAALVGNEIVANCAFTLRYDAALNSGGGGWHLSADTADYTAALTPLSLQVNGGSTLTMWLSGTVSLSFSALTGTSTQDRTFTVVGLPPTIPLVGDFVELVAPSLTSGGGIFQGFVLSTGSLNSTQSVTTINFRQSNANSGSIGPAVGIYRWATKRLVP